MENLKTVNACLVKETTEYRQEIKRLNIQLTSLVAEKDIFHGIQRDVFALFVSSSLGESVSRAAAEIASASDREKNLRKKIETLAREVDVEEIELLALAKEKYEKEKELADLKESIGSMEQSNKRERRRMNLFCSVVVVAPFIAVVVAVLMAFSIIF